IICTVPAGASYEPISVLNKSTDLTAQAFKPFAVTFADSSNFTSHSFVNTFNVGYGPYRGPKHVVAKDLDGDGKPDIATMVAGLGGGQADSLVVYHNNTIGRKISFGPRNNITPSTVYSTGYFDINDIDGDGMPDIVTSTNLNFVYVS